MCGIVGYVGSGVASDRPEGVDMGGLARLEYRGYDSAGIAIVTDNESRLDVAKRAGKLVNLAKALAETPLHEGTAAIGHTRWATHGAPTDVNAHPHLAATGRVAVVHNGIIDNAAALRAELVADGVELVSETDTELLAHLVGRAG